MRKNFVYTHPHYTVQATCGAFGSHIDIIWRPEAYMTHAFPRTLEVLQRRVPQVLETQCFNDEHLTFDEEVKNTEMGHLFEHVLLEYLWQLKTADGYAGVSFGGRTYWIESERPQWFLITTTASSYDMPYFAGALARTLAVFDEILATQMHHSTDSSGELSAVAAA